MNSLATSLAALLPIAALASQTTHTVGPGGFSQISAALAVAEPRDMILVSPGTYEPFTVDVGVKIVAISSATIAGTSAAAHTRHRTTFGPPPDQTIHVVGLDFRSAHSSQPHAVTAEGGQVVFESCTFSGGHHFELDYALDCTGADVVLRNCHFDPIHSGLSIDGGSLVATDTRILPGDSASLGLPACGVRIRDATAKLSWCDIRGLSPGSGPNPGWPAMSVSGTSSVWITESTVRGGDAVGGPPSHAIVNTTGDPVRHWRSTIIGGLGVVWLPFGIWYQHGPAFLGASSCEPLLSAVGSQRGIASGVYGFACTSEPGRTVLVMLTLKLLRPQTHPLALQPFRFDPHTAMPFGIGVTGPLGYYVPPLLQVPAGFFGKTTWLHPIMLDGNAAQAGPTLGGIVL